MSTLRNKIKKSIKRKPALFAFYWLLAFVFLFGFSVSLGIISTDEIEAETKDTGALSEDEIIPEEPTRVIIDKVGVDISILRPLSRDISILDNALEDGSVKYPGSGLAGGKNNILLFGHSSHLPIVFNKNYKAFNGIEKLEAGDEIRVLGENTEFIYKVVRVDEADAEDFRVDFETPRRLLTLSTCNNFGDLDDRFVVQAELVEARALHSSL